MTTNKKLAHTKGPWTYQGAMNSREILIAPESATTWLYQGRPCPRSIQSGEELALVMMRDTVERTGEPDGEAEANARLIASAPDLLAALKDLETELKAQGIEWTTKRENARAAIAKAEGDR